MNLEYATVGTIRISYAAALSGTDRRQLALFLPYLGGSRETVIPHLTQLSERGFTAITFDLWGSVARGFDGSLDVELALTHFRRDVWPILGQSTLDALHVLDWAIEHFDVDPRYVAAGGLSLGGDVSVALAGIDSRVKRVAAIAATPDWARPGMRSLSRPDHLIDQGQPSGYGAWLYDELDPMTHLSRYERGAAIAFELGADDTHVPPTSAFTFRDALQLLAPDAATHCRLTAHAARDHLAMLSDEMASSAAINWMAAV